MKEKLRAFCELDGGLPERATQVVDLNKMRRLFALLRGLIRDELNFSMLREKVRPFLPLTC